MYKVFRATIACKGIIFFGKGLFIFFFVQEKANKAESELGLMDALMVAF